MEKKSPKAKVKFTFINPNTTKAVQEQLKKIIVQKLLDEKINP